jgi:transcriptional regulator with XRE-family HTH domain
LVLLMSESLSSGLSRGERVRLLRERKGMTRPVLAGLVGRGPDWLKKIERGDRELTSYTMLIRLANALGVHDLADLTGEESVLVGAESRPVVPWVAELRDAVRGSLFPVAGASEAPSLGRVRERVRDAWTLWHSARLQRSQVGALLPDLVRDAQSLPRALEGRARREAYAVLADVYHLVQQATAYAVEPELYWMIADRGRMAAQESDDMLSLAGAAWAYANGLREGGFSEEAVRVVEEASSAVYPHLETAGDDMRGMYGALRLHAAITHARDGREGDAWRCWDEADSVAARLPDGYAHAWTVFGRGNTDFHAVSVNVDLKKPGVALQRGESVDLDAVPSVERRARFLVELSRGYHQRKDYVGAVYYMNRAVGASPETVKYTPSARSLTASLARQATGPLKADAAALAASAGILPA